MTDFGDTEPADAIDPSEPPDPMQVGVRLHELRRSLAEFFGQPVPPPYHELGGLEQGALSYIGAVLIKILMARAPQAGRRFQHELHEVDAPHHPEYEDMTPEARSTIDFLVEHVRSWLAGEGQPV